MSALLQRRPVTSGSPPSAAPATPPQPKPRRWAPRKLRETLTAYVLPRALVHRPLRDHLGPILASLYLSFTDYSLLQRARLGRPRQLRARCSTTPGCINSLRVTFIYVFVSVPLQLAFALALALLLDQGLRGLSFYRSVYYLPSLLGGSVAIAILWRQIFGADGLVNQFLALVRHRGRGLGLRPRLPRWAR